MIFALLGCLDRLLESPYVLTPGLGDVRSISPLVEGGLLVASSTGVYRVDEEGRAERVGDAADAVSVGPQNEYVLRGGRVSWDGGSVDVPDAVDVIAGYDELLVLFPDSYARIDTGNGLRRSWQLGSIDARSIALGPEGSYLVVSDDTLYRLYSGGGFSALVTGLVDARAAAVDAKGRIYVVHGTPQELWRLDPEGLVSVARWLGDPNDLHFGLGGLLPQENIYIANGAGTIDYVRPGP